MIHTAQEKLDDSMVEKLVARMIKNIHVEINRIHVRYEDHITFKDHPFSVGFTLNRLALESCDAGWTTTGNLKDMYAIQQIYKVRKGQYFTPCIYLKVKSLGKKKKMENKLCFSCALWTGWQCTWIRLSHNSAMNQKLNTWNYSLMGLQQWIICLRDISIVRNHFHLNFQFILN